MVGSYSGVIKRDSTSSVRRRSKTILSHHTGFRFNILPAVCCILAACVASGVFVPAASAQDTAETTDIFFNSNEAGVEAADKSALTVELERLKQSRDYSIVIEGYTDTTGEDAYNLALSKKRAEAVRSFLIENGIEAGKIKAQGKGKTEKFDSGLDEESLRRNRRVRVIFEITEAEPASTIESEVADEPPETPELVSEVEEEQVDVIVEESEPAPEPVAPALSVPGPPPSDLSETIESEIRKLAADRLIFDAPGGMKVGRTYIVEADVPYSFVKDLSESIKRMSGERFGDLNMRENIGVRLNGREFDIKTDGETSGFDLEDDGDLRRSIMKGSAEKWIWTVSPEKSGYQSLLLSIEVLVEDAKYNEMIRDYPVFQKVVDVKPNFLHVITGSYAVMAGFIIIVVAVVGWILVKKMRIA